MINFRYAYTFCFGPDLVSAETRQATFGQSLLHPSSPGRLAAFSIQLILLSVASSKHSFTIFISVSLSSCCLAPSFLIFLSSSNFIFFFQQMCFSCEYRREIYDTHFFVLENTDNNLSCYCCCTFCASRNAIWTRL